MKTFCLALATVASLCICGAADVSKLLADGAKLSDQDAARLENQLQKQAGRADEHVRLVGYWTHRSQEGNREEIIAGRARHILWLIENDPNDAVFQERESRIYPAGALGDPSTFEKGRALWEKAAHGDDRLTKSNAAEWLRTGDPEAASVFLEAADDSRAKGYFYGEAMLGVTARDFRTGDPLETSAELRGSAFARKALERIEQSTDPTLVSGAAFGFGWQAGVLYADGKMDWDYTFVLKRLLEKARELDPANLEPYAIPMELPQLGQRPPRLIRIGGSVMQKKLTAQVPPVYPPSARNGGIQGTARLNVLVGLDGGIGRMAAVSGPPILVHAAAEAVRKWRYEPVLLNGRPCYVLTVVDVNFALR